jgi:polyisoprenyl-teichoic acid--peptidoglycan teichoic acid transferase
MRLLHSRRGTVAILVAAIMIASTAVATSATRMLARDPGDGVITLLVLGSDAGPMRTGSPAAGRADGFHLLFVSPNRRHATIINIPRDAYVPVTGYGTTRINSCLVSGPDNCVRTVESLWGLDVDGYLLTSMRGLWWGVNQFGGVRVDVPTPVRDGGQPVNRAGEQHLSGGQALAYARDRKNRSGGDFDRTHAQGDLMKALHRKLRKSDANVADIMRAARIVRRGMITDLAPHELIQLGFVAADLPTKNIRNITLPGRNGSAGAASVVFLGGNAGSIIRDAARDGRVRR